MLLFTSITSDVYKFEMVYFQTLKTTQKYKHAPFHEKLPYKFLSINIKV
jgi:hypothetical protein